MTLPRYAYPRRYEDFAPGTVVAHAQRRVITEADNLLYSRLSAHEHPYFFAYAQKREGRIPANPLLVLGIVGGLAVRATSQSAIANLGWLSISFPARAYIGDELHAVSEILDKRISAGDPGRGIITIRTSGLNEHDDVVSVATRAFLVAV